ncbi:MAG: AmmeMemoRadiSam system protein B [Candidatus Competibacteraceae bacterium]
MQTIRTPAVAGQFYPADPAQLHIQVRQFLSQVEPPDEPPPKAIIVPHAGYMYSGPVAASAYRNPIQVVEFIVARASCPWAKHGQDARATSTTGLGCLYARMKAVRDRITRVVLLGPSHRVGFRGIAVSTMTAFATPLGQIPLDQEAVERVRPLPEVGFLEQAHAQEHSLEVHLPFLQEVLGNFRLMPLVVGDASPAEVGAVLEALWGGPETLIVISSDLSHYHDYRTAQHLDNATSKAIEALRFEDIGYDQACGRNPVNGLLWVARRKNLHGETIDLRNSGDTAGPRNQVVGYGAYVFH